MRKLLLFIFILCIGCRKDPPPLPGKAQLIFPKSNEVCADGLIVSATRSSIQFRWSAATNADSYVLTIKNLDNGQTATHTTDKVQLNLELDRNVPYSWFILSKNTKTNKELSSDIWKFFNPGPAQTSFSPFPAELISPKYGEIIPLSSSKVTLRWSAADPDGDIDIYDVYLGNTSEPVLYKTGLKDPVLADLTLDRNKVYYWKISTRDLRGNRSISDIYTFKLD